MPELCQSTELVKAGGLVNSLFANHPISLGCRIEIGKKVIGDAVALLPREARDEVVAHLLEAMFALRELCVALAPAPSLVATASHQELDTKAA